VGYFLILVVYNANLNGAFVPIRLSFFYGTGGAVESNADMTPLGAYTYDTDLQPGTTVKLVFQLIIAAYVLYEYILKEIYEVMR
jgi:hypothetical protein